MKTIRTWVFALLFATTLGGGTSAIMVPASASAACGDAMLLTMPAWYRGIAKDENGGCSIQNPNDVGGIGPFVWKIVLNIIDILLNLTAYFSVGYIMYGGFKYMLASGSSDGITKAKTTITNAVIGLVISIAAIAIVNLIAGAF